jgi:hypothetical protein
MVSFDEFRSELIIMRRIEVSRKEVASDIKIITRKVFNMSRSLSIKLSKKHITITVCHTAVLAHAFAQLTKRWIKAIH